MSLAVAVVNVVLASGAVDGRCFDLETTVVAPLSEPGPRQPQDVTASGERADGVSWAKARGDVELPIVKVLALLLDHQTGRDPQIDELLVEAVSTTTYLARHRVKFLVKPFPFVEVRWIEDWAYALTAGTREAPEEVVISFQKSEGTEHITRSCGSIVLRSTSAATTEVYEYVERRIATKNAKDALAGVKGLLRVLRGSVRGR